MGWHPERAAAESQERLLRSDQVAARLNCTPRRVQQLCREHRLVAVKWGPRIWMISEKAVREYLEGFNRE